MGNAGTGSYQSPGAVYYNPAGMAWLGSSRLSAQGSAYQSLRVDTDSVGTLDGVDEPQNNSSFQIIPHSVISSFRLDNWSFATALLVPFSLQQTNRARWESSLSTESQMTVSQSQDLWIGFGVARELNSDWSVGLSLFGVYGTGFTHYADRILKKDLSTLTNSISALDYSSFHAVAVAGILTKISPKWSVGLRIQSPSVKISEQGHIIFTSDTYTSGNTPPLSSTTVDEGIGFSQKQPVDIQLGTEFLIGNELSALFDLGYQFGSESTVTLSGVTTKDKYLASPRIRSGFEWRVSPKLAIETGVGIYSNPTENSSTNYTSRSLFYSGTLGVRWSSSERVMTSVGVAYLRNSAKGKVSSASTKENTQNLEVWTGLLSIGYLLN